MRTALNYGAILITHDLILWPPLPKTWSPGSSIIFPLP